MHIYMYILENIGCGVAAPAYAVPVSQYSIGNICLVYSQYDGKGDNVCALKAPVLELMVSKQEHFIARDILAISEEQIILSTLGNKQIIAD